jgi:hypothetical protein
MKEFEFAFRVGESLFDGFDGFGGFLGRACRNVDLGVVRIEYLGKLFANSTGRTGHNEHLGPINQPASDVTELEQELGQAPCQLDQEDSPR